MLREQTGHLLLTVDMLVESVDFDLAYASGYDVGWKSVAVNASDIAAMGGRPSHAVAALGLRPDLPVAFFEDLLTGLLDAAARWGATLAGGDLSGATEVTLSVTMTGRAEGEPVFRSGARQGDALCVTGSLGGSAGGLFALQSGLTDPALEGLVQRHLRPDARVDAGAVVAAHGATAMIDISDGLLIDALRLSTAGGIGCDIVSAEVPVDGGLAALSGIAGAPDPRHMALTGGEDYELLFTVPETAIEPLRAGLTETNTKLTRIGTITDGEPMLDGEPLDEREDLGWDHLRDP